MTRSEFIALLISAMVRDKYLPEMVDLICGGLPK